MGSANSYLTRADSCVGSVLYMAQTQANM